MPHGSVAYSCMIDRTTNKSWFDNMVWGLLSGFPYCCVRFWVTTWNPAVEETFRLRLNHTEAWQYLTSRWPQPLNADRIYCPRCETPEGEDTLRQLVAVYGEAQR